MHKKCLSMKGSRRMDIKLAECDGDLEQLLVKARFEETTIRDLGSAGIVLTLRKPVVTTERTSTPSKEASGGGRQTRDRYKDTSWMWRDWLLFTPMSLQPNCVKGSRSVGNPAIRFGGPCTCLGSQTSPPVPVWPQVSGDHRS